MNVDFRQLLVPWLYEVLILTVYDHYEQERIMNYTGLMETSLNLLVLLVLLRQPCPQPCPQPLDPLGFGPTICRGVQCRFRHSPNPPQG
jgi:hypothetical protein